MSERRPETGCPEGTYSNESLLPRVPLPTLEQSAERFLEWSAPLLTGDELAETERAVADLLAPGSAARALHAALEQHDADDGVHSWLDDFWRQRYLGRRDRIALNANFFFLFEPSPLGQLERSAQLLAAAVGYKQRLDAEQVPPAVQHGRPLSMQQHRYLFSATRIPGAEQDTVRSPHTEQWPGPSQERHVLVLRRGHMLRLDVLDEQGRPYTAGELVAGLQAVLAAAAPEPAPGASVGPLTSTARAPWAASRQQLLDVHADNAELLDTVERALLCLCLEELAPEGTEQACAHLLHGDSRNRWFDKALSLIVFADGTAGLNAEHSKLDGTTILNVVDALLGDPAAATVQPAPAEPRRTPAVHRLQPVLDAPLQSALQSAAADFAAAGADTAASVLSFGRFGVTDLKQLGMSPDAFVQLAYQLAHRRARARVGATYESVATRHFQHGRTEAMRVVTPEVLRFVAAMDDPPTDGDSRRAAFRAAAGKHVERARQCQAGQAPEQHLWELQLLQQRRGAELGVSEPLALHTSPGWLIMREDHLSTSSAPSPHIQHFGFGPTSGQCIGIAYVLLPDRLNLYLTAPRAIADQLQAFSDQLQRAVGELRALLTSERPG